MIRRHRQNPLKSEYGTRILADIKRRQTEQKIEQGLAGPGTFLAIEQRKRLSPLAGVKQASCLIGQFIGVKY